ncbi:carbonic anhydrase [Gryllotalpicola ginsengisoli]|uniref:carbonic anhydrase n=1 Tax=Gryllotalpicola ginsengisoli TaxID=444608 RepID=UPI0003B7765B|nr:carbonic anhydrase [Gryllotalpicola ginsengisoli]
MARTTPAQAWQILQDGNRRFVEGTPQHPRQDVERRGDLASGQHPVVAIFGCADSRLAAEIIFDLGLGDAFVVRNAGQVASDSVLGSLEYAVGVLGVSLILVLGHDECGAVRAAIDSQAADAEALSPNISQLIAPIVPAVRRVARVRGDEPVDAAALDAHEVGREHLRDTVTDLLTGSELISRKVVDGELGVVGANYRLREGTAVPDVLIGLS